MRYDQSAKDDPCDLVEHWFAKKTRDQLADRSLAFSVPLAQYHYQGQDLVANFTARIIGDPSEAWFIHPQSIKVYNLFLLGHELTLADLPQAIQKEILSLPLTFDPRDWRLVK